MDWSYEIGLSLFITLAFVGFGITLYLFIEDIFYERHKVARRKTKNKFFDKFF